MLLFSATCFLDCTHHFEVRSADSYRIPPFNTFEVGAEEVGGEFKQMSVLDRGRRTNRYWD